METGDHLKNGASLKSHTSRGNFLKIFFVIAVLCCCWGCKKDNNNSGNNNKEWVEINGVKWATRNLGAGGVFVTNPEDHGALFQWGRRADGHENRTSPISEGPISGANLDGNGQPAGSYIGKFITGLGGNYDWRTPQDNALWNSDTELTPVKTVNDPCPDGWRVPTHEELVSLANAGSKWTTINGVNGRIFGTGNNTIFLPAPGCRAVLNGNVNSVGTVGGYWSSSAYYMYFSNTIVNPSRNDSRAPGLSIRCVKE
jgi:uncharacterized protein (TIGR02145 family)